jgi:hypothetical protein
MRRVFDAPREIGCQRIECERGERERRGIPATAVVENRQKSFDQDGKILCGNLGATYVGRQLDRRWLIAVPCCARKQLAPERESGAGI